MTGKFVSKEGKRKTKKQKQAEYDEFCVKFYRSMMDIVHPGWEEERKTRQDKERS